MQKCTCLNDGGTEFSWIVRTLKSHADASCINHMKRNLPQSHADAIDWNHMKRAALKSHDDANASITWMPPLWLNPIRQTLQNI